MSLFNSSNIEVWITNPYALVILALLSFSESAFFIIPPEVMVIPMAIAAPHYAIWYGLYISVTSLLGAMLGFFLGKRGGQPLLRRLFKEEHTQSVERLFNKYDTKAIFIAAFTPIPYKVFTISAGVFNLDFKRFMVASTIGRSSRYLIITGLIALFGKKIQYFIENKLDLVIGVGTVALIALVAFYKLCIPWIEEKWLKRTFKDIVVSWFRHRPKMK